MAFSDKWKFSGYSSETATRRIWCHELKDNKFVTDILFNTLQERIGRRYSLNSVYANGQTHGQSGSWHVDIEGAKTNDYFTVLYYLNDCWDMEWGGATVFRHENTYDNSFFIPNSAILFNSTIEHVGLEPTIHYNGLRMTIAFKLKEINND